MNRFFYGRLAYSNLKKNSGLYLPYILAAVGVSAMYYIMGAISRDEGIKKMPGSGDMAIILGLGCWVIAIFAVIFLFYTNSFLMKRRKKEFGLFNILGMEKRHIGKMMFWEMLMVGGVSIACGIAAGILFNKLVVLVLVRLVDLEVPFGFSISVEAIINMVILFGCIFAVTLIYNLFQVQKARPIELLQSANQGEKEPKTRWIMTVMGVLYLAGGYGIALLVKDPISVLMLFFLAVILVMAGTYCLFTAGSIAVLKLLRKNKNYYYKINHFTSVSGMIYRMKQNAVGLSNICILSTMVLVMISGTVSLYMGVEDSMKERYPKKINMTGYNLTPSGKEAMRELARRGVSDLGIEMDEVMEYNSLSVMTHKDGETFNLGGNGIVSKGEVSITQWITLEDYESLGGKHIELMEDEVLVYTMSGDTNDQQYRLGDKSFRIKQYLPELAIGGTQSEVIYDVYFLITKDESVLKEISKIQKEAYKDRANNIVTTIHMDVTGDKEQEITCANHIIELLESYNQTLPEEERIDVRVYSREDMKEGFMIFCGGFLFLGIFLGFIFLVATVLIIYYKQISEGYEDKSRFEIMQKVGMSKKEVRASIRSQVLKVFFLPLVMACVHLAVAFPLMNRLILMFGMVNVPLFAICTVATVGVFAVIYAIVYGITARSYYKIVG